jgi:hypothetical protein
MPAPPPRCDPEAMSAGATSGTRVDLNGLAVAVVPCAPGTGPTAARITVGSALDGRVVPGALDRSGALHGLPVPALPDRPVLEAWTVTPRISETSDPAGGAWFGPDEVLVRWLPAHRSPTVELEITPRMTAVAAGGAGHRWERLWLHVRVEAAVSPDEVVTTDLEPVAVHQLVVGVPRVAVLSPTSTRARPAVVVLDSAGPLRSLEEARATLTSLRDALAPFGGVVGRSAAHGFAAAVEAIGSGPGRSSTELVVAHRRSAVLPVDVSSVLATGCPGDELHLRLAADPSIPTVAVTVGPSGVTVARDVAGPAPASTPVQHVRRLRDADGWDVPFAPALRFV